MPPNPLKTGRHVGLVPENSARYRAISSDATADKAAFKTFLEPLYHTRWHVYAKPPFAGPQQVLAYLARYTHRVGISNSRLIKVYQGR